MHVMQVEVQTPSHHLGLLHKETPITPEAWEALRQAVPGVELPTWEIANPDRVWESGEYGRWWDLAGLVTTAELEALSRFGFKPTVSRVRGLFSEAHPSAVLADAGRLGGVNIDISVPGGVALMSVQSVTWLEDCCTENLQRWLDGGWRIVAVCPPNDTRRPTYILGHQNPGQKEPRL